MHQYLEKAMEAAKLAADLQKSRLWGEVAVSFKGAVDLVTEVDRESEALIVGLLRREWPDHDILAEENAYDSQGSRFRWIIDPLDGTTNFAHGFPWFGPSIALEMDGEIVVGVVCHVMMDEMFSAVKGEGAFLNGRRLSVSRNAPLLSTVLATGFPYDRTSDNENNFGYFVDFHLRVQGVRRAGAAALDLAYVAAGRLDGFWECKLKPWDVAAGKLLIEEAGGRVTGYGGEAYSVYDHRILASNGLIHDEMAEVLRRGRTD